MFERRRVIGLLLVSIVVVGTLGMFRGPIARWMWHTTHVLPELILVLSGDASLGMEMGRYYLGIGDNPAVYNIQKADQLFTRTLLIDENVSMGWYERAHIAFLYGDHERAIEYLGNQINMTAESVPQAYYLLGLAQGFNGDVVNAVSSFNVYLDIVGGTNWYTYNNIAWAYFQLGQFAEAETAAEEGLAIDPQNPWLLMSAGMSAYNLEKFDIARERLEEADRFVETLTVYDWLRTYPKNDPKIAILGLTELRDTIRSNLELVHKAQIDTTESDI